MDSIEKTEWRQVASTFAVIFLFVAILILYLDGRIDFRRHEVSEFKPISKTSPAKRYEAEFVMNDSHSRIYKPNGSLKIEEEIDDRGKGILGAPSCRTYWLKIENGPRKRIFSASDGERGKGREIDYFWSNDSKAIYFTGYHSGIDCPRKPTNEQVQIVYTIADGVVWTIQMYRAPSYYDFKA